MVKLFDEKLIHVNGHKATPHTEVAVDDVIWIAMAKEKIDHEPIAMDLHILYEDDDLLIVDKPAGVTVNSKIKYPLLMALPIILWNMVLSEKYVFEPS